LRFSLSCAAAFACLLAMAASASAADHYLGNMKADSILFLGNSITLHPPRDDSGVYWPNNWGMAASSADKDYVHLLANSIDHATGGNLLIHPTDRPAKIGDPIVVGDANVVNIADIFERNYPSYSASKLQYQINAKPNIVVLQFGENMGGLSDANVPTFTNSLRTLLTDLRTNGNPNIFVTGFILGGNSDIDNIKKALCAEDPVHRVFVDMTGVPHAGSGLYGHPDDIGMQNIAGRLYSAMVAHGVPEPSAVAMLVSGGLILGGLVWRRRNRG
jgi:hypothetical protein